MDQAGDANGDDRVLIVGGGMAGSLLALALGRAGLAVTVLDPRRDPAPTFRNEKLGHEQIALLTRLGMLHCFEEACWPGPGDPHAYPEGARPHLADCGAPHQTWLRQVRAAWPANVEFVEALVDKVEISDDLQQVEVDGGDRIAGRLLVLATGRLPRLRESLGVRERTISAGHSVCLGFSVAMDRPLAAEVIPTPFGTGVGYVSLFPMPGETRVNVFSYRPLDDPWTRRMSRKPMEALAEISPYAAGLLDGARLVRRCEARGTDLYAVADHQRPGLILLGDAFHAPCPASGSGMLRILNDVAILADIAPCWLATPGMGCDKIAAFYTHPDKRRLDARSLAGSLRGRRVALDPAPYWATWRRLGRIKRRLSGGVQYAAPTAGVQAMNWTSRPPL